MKRNKTTFSKWLKVTPQKLIDITMKIQMYIYNLNIIYDFYTLNMSYFY